MTGKSPPRAGASAAGTAIVALTRWRHAVTAVAAALPSQEAHVTGAGALVDVSLDLPRSLPQPSPGGWHDFLVASAPDTSQGTHQAVASRPDAHQATQSPRLAMAVALGTWRHLRPVGGTHIAHHSSRLAGGPSRDRGSRRHGRLAGSAALGPRAYSLYHHRPPDKNRLRSGLDPDAVRQAPDNPADQTGAL